MPMKIKIEDKYNPQVPIILKYLFLPKTRNINEISTLIPTKNGILQNPLTVNKPIPNIPQYIINVPNIIFSLKLIFKYKYIISTFSNARIIYFVEHNTKVSNSFCYY